MYKRQGLFIIVVLVVLVKPFSEPVRGYSMHDYVRGDSFIAVRLPHTMGSEGYINVTAQHKVIGPSGMIMGLVPEGEFQALMDVREVWCQKPDVTFTEAEQTPNYILAVQCKPFNKQFELTKDQLPMELQYLLERTRIP